MRKTVNLTHPVETPSCCFPRTSKELWQHVYPFSPEVLRPEGTARYLPTTPHLTGSNSKASRARISPFPEVIKRCITSWCFSVRHPPESPSDMGPLTDPQRGCWCDLSVKPVPPAAVNTSARQMELHLSESYCT